MLSKYTNFHGVVENLKDHGYNVRLFYRTPSGAYLLDDRLRRRCLAYIYPSKYRFSEALALGAYVRGESGCSRKDTFNKKVGRDIALGRAYKALKSSPITAIKSTTIDAAIKEVTGIDRRMQLQARTCPFCYSVVDTTKLKPDYYKEWIISGMCAACQDETFS